MQEPVPGISAVPDEANARYFHVVVAGKWEMFLFIILENVLRARVMPLYNDKLCFPFQDPKVLRLKEEYSN